MTNLIFGGPYHQSSKVFRSRRFLNVLVRHQCQWNCSLRIDASENLDQFAFFVGTGRHEKLNSDFLPRFDDGREVISGDAVTRGLISEESHFVPRVVCDADGAPRSLVRSDSLSHSRLPLDDERFTAEYGD
jgi:hypothetical protein